MADRIKMDTEQLEAWAEQLSQVSSTLSQAEAALRRVSTGDDWWRKVNMNRSIYLKDAGRNVSINGGRDAVRELIGAIDLYQDRTKQLKNVLNKNAGVFADAESEVVGLVQGSSQGAESDVYNAAKQFSNAFAKILKFRGNYDSWSKQMKEQYDALIQKLGEYTVDENGDYIFTGEGIEILIGANGMLKKVCEYGGNMLHAERTIRTYDEDGGYSEEKDELGFEVLKGKHKLKEGGKNFWDDKKKKGFKGNEDGAEAKRVGTIFAFGYEKSGKVANWHEEGAGQYGIASGSYSTDALYAEGNYGITGGLYVSKIGKDGKEYFAFEPGVHGEIGGSVGVWQGSAEGRLGNDVFAVTGECGASFLEAEGKAELNLGMVDGKFAAAFEAKAEANLVKAEGSVGVDIMGVEGKVGGSVSVGIGAHADFGYHDGKLTFDIGASLGVGASVTAEVDVSGLVENVGDAVESLADAAGDIGDAAADAVSDIADAAADAAKSAKKAADKFVNAAQKKCEAVAEFFSFW